MDAIKFIEERNRMCGTMSEVWGVDAEQIVKNTEEWSATHPLKTRQSIFLEQWPNAEIHIDGVLDFCPHEIDKSYRCKSTDIEVRCQECRREFWGQEV